MTTNHHTPERIAVGIDGSIASHLARHARVPLVIVPAPRQPREPSL